MNLPPTFKWIGLALLGLAIAVGVAFASSNLVSRQIGISSESIRAGDALAPVVGTGKGQRPSHERKGSLPATDEETTTTPSAGSEPPASHPAGPAEEPTPGERPPSESHDDYVGSGSSGDGGDGADD